MWEYILKSGSCMAVFLLFYKILLEKESMHNFKRFYLLGVLVASFIIPCIVFVDYVSPIAAPNLAVPLSHDLANTIASENPTEMQTINWSLILWTLYSIGFIGFGIRFLKHLFQITHRIKTNPKVKEDNSIKVLLHQNLPPHTFFNYIFLNQHKFEANAIPKEVLLHEETHARQKHSLDVLFIEVLQVLLWFNPLVYLLKKSIKLNHEFLADTAVLKKSASTYNYQNILLSYLSQETSGKYQSAGIANAINYSSIKKRFTVMKKRTSKTGIVLRVFLLLPLFTLLLYGFSEHRTIEQLDTEHKQIIQKKVDQKEIAEYNALAKKYYELPTGSLLISGKKDFILPSSKQVMMTELERIDYVYNKMSAKQKRDAEPYPFLKLPNYNQKSASNQQMAEYNALAKKYNEMDKNHMRVLIDEVDRLEYIYGLMSDKQKADAEPFPDFPEPPPTPNIPIEPQGFSEHEAKIIGQEKKTGTNIPAPPAPPKPIAPLDYVIQMAKKGATFYYDGKEISSDKAIELMRKNKGINIDSQRKKGVQEVTLSKEPITIK